MPGDRSTQGVRSDVAPSHIVEELRGLLGARLVAFIGGAGEAALVHEWASGVREPAASAMERYRIALVAARAISARDGREVAQVWFQGLNPDLDDRSPAVVLRDLTDAGDADAVLGAASQQVVGP